MSVAPCEAPGWLKTAVPAPAHGHGVESTLVLGLVSGHLVWESSCAACIVRAWRNDLPT